MHAKFIQNLSRFGNGQLTWHAILAAGLVIASAQPGSSDSGAVPKCLSSTPIKATVGRVINSQTFETTSGLVIKLAAIEAPITLLTFEGQKNGDLVEAGRKLLQQLILNKSVTLRFNAKQADRYGRRVAHVFVSVQNKSDNTWVQAEMTRQGRARVFPNTVDARCIKALLEIEKAARQKQIGLWKNRLYQISQAEDLKYLNRSLGRLHLIEGWVHSVAVRRSRSYINFSKDWKRDFTVTLNRRAYRSFTQSGMNIKELTGKHIRIRGWLDRHNGPTIKAYHVTQIEILEN